MLNNVEGRDLHGGDEFIVLVEMTRLEKSEWMLCSWTCEIYWLGDNTSIFDE